MTIKVITGYFPAFPAKHLSEDKFRALGARLQEAAPDMLDCGKGWRLDKCWANKFWVENPGLMPSCTVPPPDRFAGPQDMVASNIAILERFEWLRAASLAYPEVDTWVWLEYTICKQPGVTTEVIKKFLKDVEERPYNAISIPGCWDKRPVNDADICWRFCGSAWVCPRRYAAPLFEAVKSVVTMRTKATGTISWDVNTLAFVELLDVLPIRWYSGDHNASQLANYKGA
jgi:hypothetical protein